MDNNVIPVQLDLQQELAALIRFSMDAAAGVAIENTALTPLHDAPMHGPHGKRWLSETLHNHWELANAVLEDKPLNVVFACEALIAQYQDYNRRPRNDDDVPNALVADSLPLVAIEIFEGIRKKATAVADTRSRPSVARVPGEAESRLEARLLDTAQMASFPQWLRALLVEAADVVATKSGNVANAASPTAKPGISPPSAGGHAP